MSDLYLVLRRRLESVPEWVYLPTADLRAARDRVGLSYESLARQLHVSSKTWERYEKAGRIPRHIVPDVAQLLNLEIEEPKVGPITARPAEGETVSLEKLIAEIRGLRRDLRPVLQLVEQLREDRAQATPETSRAP